VFGDLYEVTYYCDFYKRTIVSRGVTPRLWARYRNTCEPIEMGIVGTPVWCVNHIPRVLEEEQPRHVSCRCTPVMVPISLTPQQELCRVVAAPITKFVDALKKIQKQRENIQTELEQLEKDLGLWR
jgi:hypothetical protein